MDINSYLFMEKYASARYKRNVALVASMLLKQAGPDNRRKVGRGAVMKERMRQDIFNGVGKAGKQPVNLTPRKAAKHWDWIGQNAKTPAPAPVAPTVAAPPVNAVPSPAVAPSAPPVAPPVKAAPAPAAVRAPASVAPPVAPVAPPAAPPVKAVPAPASAAVKAPVSSVAAEASSAVKAPAATGRLNSLYKTITGTRGGRIGAIAAGVGGVGLSLYALRRYLRNSRAN